MSLVELIDFPVLGDNRGKLVVIEGNRHVPFEIKRVYYIYGTSPDVARGFHAHKELRQVAVCLSGQCRIVMDDGSKKEDVTLKSPSQALLVDKMQWHEMYDFSSDCVLMVLASNVYDESDYIRDYESFISLSGEL
ncbi:FdtA/QdtA family cupin domain-containing protein [Aeromonas sanarellii]